jgi:hypothetical protein
MATIDNQSTAIPLSVLTVAKNHQKRQNTVTTTTTTTGVHPEPDRKSYAAIVRTVTTPQPPAKPFQQVVDSPCCRSNNMNRKKEDETPSW